MGMKREKLLTTLLSLIAIFFFGTFAYSFYELTDVGTVLTASITTGRVGVVFSDGTTAYQYKPLMSGGSSLKTFTIDNINNTGNVEATIYFKDLVNTYMEGSLVYSLSYSTSPNGPYTTLVHNRNVPRSSSKTNAALYGKVYIPRGSKYYYKLEISLKNPELVGTTDVNASMSSMFFLDLGYTDESALTLGALELESKGEITDFRAFSQVYSGPGYCTNYNGTDEDIDCFNTAGECFDAEQEKIQENAYCGYIENVNNSSLLGAEGNVYFPNGIGGYCTNYFDSLDGSVNCFPTQSECFASEIDTVGGEAACYYYENAYESDLLWGEGVVYWPVYIEPGVYEADDNYGTSYYFRGDEDNNTVYLPVTLDGNAYYHEVGFDTEDGLEYVQYGPFDTMEECEAHEGKGLGDVASAPCYGSARVEGLEFKIIRINGDGTLRLIRTEGILGAEAYENGGGTFGSIHSVQYVDSNAQYVLEEWYNSTLLAEYDGLVSKTTMFCNDLNYYNHNNYSFDSRFRTTTGVASLYCNARKPGMNMGNSQLSVGSGLNYPVGLITADEFIMSGSANSYLRMEHAGWTMSPDSYYPNLQYIPYDYFTFSSAGLGYFREQFEEGGPSYPDFYPVINLTADYARTLVWNDTIKAYVDPNKDVILPPDLGNVDSGGVSGDGKWCHTFFEDELCYNTIDECQISYEDRAWGEETDCVYITATSASGYCTTLWDSTSPDVYCYKFYDACMSAEMDYSMGGTNQCEYYENAYENDLLETGGVVIWPNGTPGGFGDVTGSGDWCHTYFGDEYCYETYDECYEGYEEHSSGLVTGCVHKIPTPGYCTAFMAEGDVSCYGTMSECESAEIDQIGDTYQCAYYENVYESDLYLENSIYGYSLIWPNGITDSVDPPDDSGDDTGGESGYCTNYFSGDEIYYCFTDQNDCYDAEERYLGGHYQCDYYENVYVSPGGVINWPSVDSDDSGDETVEWCYCYNTMDEFGSVDCYSDYDSCVEAEGDYGRDCYETECPW